MGPSNALRIATLLLAALAMGMKLAHALELLPKLQWDAALYLQVQSSLYRVFGVLGPLFELGALACVAVQARLLRGKNDRPYVLVSLGAISLSVLDFAVFVRQANVHLQAWAATGVRPEDWEHWRAQWQYGQTASFVLHFVSLWALTKSLLVAR